MTERVCLVEEEVAQLADGAGASRRGECRVWGEPGMEHLLNRAGLSRHVVHVSMGHAAASLH